MKDLWAVKVLAALDGPRFLPVDASAEPKCNRFHFAGEENCLKTARKCIADRPSAKKCAVLERPEDKLIH